MVHVLYMNTTTQTEIIKIEESKTLNNNEFRKLVKGKNIKVFFEDTYQNNKVTKLFRSPKLVLSSETTRFGTVNDCHYLQASPVDMITQSGNIIEMFHSDYKTITWIVEILGVTN